MGLEGGARVGQVARTHIALFPGLCASQALLLTELSSCSVTKQNPSVISGRLPSSLGLSTRNSVDLPVFQRQVVKMLDRECEQFSTLVY